MAKNYQRRMIEVTAAELQVPVDERSLVERWRAEELERAGFGDRSEHSRIEGVHLVGAIEPDIGDAVCDREPDAIFHGTISFLLLLRTRRAWLHGATRAELGGVERSKTKRGAHCRDR